MELQELKKALAAEAKAKGICEDWYKHILNAPSKERLMFLFVKGLDFCVDKDFPSAELRAEFAGVKEHYGVFIDQHVNATNKKNVVAFGTAEGNAYFDNFGVANVWAYGNSKLTVTAKDNAFVCVLVADKAEVEVTASGQARVSVILHGGKITTQKQEAARIKVIDKRNSYGNRQH